MSFMVMLSHLFINKLLLFRIMKLRFCLALVIYLSFLSSCCAQSLKDVNVHSKTYTKKAMDLMDTIYFLETTKDTLEYRQAILYLDSAIYLDSSNYYAVWKKSEFLCVLKQYDDALFTISSYCNAHKENMDFLLREAYLFEKLGNSESANRNFIAVLNNINLNLEKKANKKLMMNKIMILILLEDKTAKSYFDSIKREYLNEEDISIFDRYLNNFSKSDFIDYQLTVINSDITVR